MYPAMAALQSNPVSDIHSSETFLGNHPHAEYAFYDYLGLQSPSIPEIIRDISSSLYARTHNFQDVSHLPWTDQQEILRLFLEVADCFRNDLQSEPANLPPTPINLLPNVK